MVNPNGRRGAYWETRLAAWLASELDLKVERRARNGRKDRGDITGIPGVVIEAKNEKKRDLPRYLREAEIERDNDGAELGFVMLPYRGHSVAQGFSIFTNADAVRILRTLTLGEPWR